MRIGIIGSGNVGGALTHCLRALGRDVAVASSRGPASLATLANETGARAAAPDGRGCQTSFTQG
jgi:predicted dinucleotide-binding enzyme